RQSGEWRTIYLRKKAQGKTAKQALVVVAVKLLHALYAMLKHRQPYNPSRLLVAPATIGTWTLMGCFGGGWVAGGWETRVEQERAGLIEHGRRGVSRQFTLLRRTPRTRPQTRNGRKKARMSAARASGCSSAAKWPPLAIVVQRWMFSRCSAIERGGRTIS